jgi:hypothetical protein
MTPETYNQLPDDVKALYHRVTDYLSDIPFSNGRDKIVDRIIADAWDVMARRQLKMLKELKQTLE